MSTHAFETPGQAFKSGAQNTIPLIVGAIPFGIVFGTLGPVNGLSFEATLCMSLIVFAGSAQFISLGLLAAGASPWLIVLTTFVVNLRHLLYAVTLIPMVRTLPQRWRAPMAFWLTDETFAVVAGRLASEHRGQFHWYYLGSALSMYLNWQLCTLLGLTLGEWVPDIENWGLDVAMAVTFIGIVAPQVVNRPRLAAVLAAGVCSVWWRDWPHQLGLFAAALTGILCGLGAEMALQDRKSELAEGGC
ncbi:predicted branched-chain amino acid permease (azaleucine resistance) [Hahella chejuensis KCTC 2396]|uniref:Predicted branched-chain amino acid permease (Azaleucine resistance) n=1 Tax=Hahella chejuensis (strain KCTC 2396) TaxID=349521 RepID=Q2SNK4_HAHCH|nr:AzlC family ABC transporter permease [Hahella chejuensis]ABC27770.1 predicted branched-chain amino acid permease (azaleucine resistance) [Hahella chejuensis KCTC 2396]